MMNNIQERWKQRIRIALLELAEKQGIDTSQVPADEIPVETPPRLELGDAAFPLFAFARVFKRSPANLAEEIVQNIASSGVSETEGEARATGPYVNVFFHRPSYFSSVIAEAVTQDHSYGQTDTLSGQRVMVEFSCPNTNKPLHLGHLRNDIIGESVSRILAANGADVRKVNLINDRGIHICKSMLAYERFGNGTTPESEGVKSDHFVGNYYVRFNQWAKDDPSADDSARKMLQAWEDGEAHTIELWKQMNKWALDGIWKTYEHTGISFDQVYFESDTYVEGRKEVLKGLEQGAFYRDSDGSVWVDLEEISLDKKVLLRSDGTSLYLTQDIGTAIARHRDWAFDRLIYVVGSEQRYHFTVLFHVLEKLGMEWAGQLYHLAYGMVNLTEGKMKSREGTVVDGDDLLAKLEALAAEEIRSKEREEAVGNIEETAGSIALGALHYYLLQTSPNKDMIFDPAESLSFNGNTGPYLQYMGARISSMLRRIQGEKRAAPEEIDFSLLTVAEEWELIRLLGEYPDRVRMAGEQYNPQVIAAYLYDLAKTFSRYYHDNPIVTGDDRAVREARIALTTALLAVLRSGFDLIAIPFLETM